MAFLKRQTKRVLLLLAEEFDTNVSERNKVLEIIDAITKARDYDEETAGFFLERILDELEKERRDKEKDRQYELDVLRLKVKIKNKNLTNNLNRELGIFNTNSGAVSKITVDNETEKTTEEKSIIQESMISEEKHTDNLPDEAIIRESREIILSTDVVEKSGDEQSFVEQICQKGEDEPSKLIQFSESEKGNSRVEKLVCSGLKENIMSLTCSFSQDISPDHLGDSVLICENSKQNQMPSCWIGSSSVSDISSDGSYRKVYAENKNRESETADYSADGQVGVVLREVDKPKNEIEKSEDLKIHLFRTNDISVNSKIVSNLHTRIDARKSQLCIMGEGKTGYFSPIISVVKPGKDPTLSNVYCSFNAKSWAVFFFHRGTRQKNGAVKLYKFNFAVKFKEWLSIRYNYKKRKEKATQRDTDFVTNFGFLFKVRLFSFLLL